MCCGVGIIIVVPFVVTRDQYGSEHLTTGVMELSFKYIRISPSSSAQQTRDTSLYAIPYTSDLMLISFVIDLLLRSIIWTWLSMSTDTAMLLLSIHVT